MHEIIAELVEISDELDKRGLLKEADLLDGISIVLANQIKEAKVLTLEYRNAIRATQDALERVVSFINQHANSKNLSRATFDQEIKLPYLRQSLKGKRLAYLLKVLEVYIQTLLPRIVEEVKTTPNADDRLKTMELATALYNLKEQVFELNAAIQNPTPIASVSIKEKDKLEMAELYSHMESLGDSVTREKKILQRTAAHMESSNRFVLQKVMKEIQNPSPYNEGKKPEKIFLNEIGGLIVFKGKNAVDPQGRFITEQNIESLYSAMVGKVSFGEIEESLARANVFFIEESHGVEGYYLLLRVADRSLPRLTDLRVKYRRLVTGAVKTAATFEEGGDEDFDEDFDEEEGEEDITLSKDPLDLSLFSLPSEKKRSREEIPVAITQTSKKLVTQYETTFEALAQHLTRFNENADAMKYKTDILSEGLSHTTVGPISTNVLEMNKKVLDYLK